MVTDLQMAINFNRHYVGAVMVSFYANRKIFKWGVMMPKMVVVEDLV